MAEDKRQYTLVRYEIEIGLDAKSNELGLNHETLWLRPRPERCLLEQQSVFPFVPESAPDIFVGRSQRGFKVAVKKNPGSNDNYYTEGAKSYKPSFKLGRGKLALTIPAYLKDLTGVFLIEELENGIHPRAIETVVQSLSSIYGGQVLIATHSPVALTAIACLVSCPAFMNCRRALHDEPMGVSLRTPTHPRRTWCGTVRPRK